MKKTGKIILYVVIFILIVIVAGVSYISLALPNVGPPESITIKITPERVARGKYLAENVAACFTCHSRRDLSKFSGPASPVNRGGGGDTFDEKNGFPGLIVIPNITMFNLKNWTDGELLRALTCGVNRNGKAMFPIMPYPQYAKMDREDLYSIIAYLRTVAPVPIDNFKQRLNFPFNLLLNTMPKKAEVKAGIVPKTTDSVKYGAYLVTLGICEVCHSRTNAIGLAVPDADFAGGRKITTPGTINSLPVTFINWTANITPDLETGIGKWNSARFVKRFKVFADTTKIGKISKGDFQSIMPWAAYAHMSEGDLKSIFAYLKTIKPVHHKIAKVFQLADEDADVNSLKDE